MSSTVADPQSLLEDRFGLEHFRPGQRQVIDHLLQGHSAAAVFPTGGGKSLCYQLPALTFDGLTLVVSPLIALMKDQIDALKRRGIAAARLDSSISAEANLKIIQALREGQLRLLYVAPERFGNERFRELLSQLTVSLFAVDEAHCISEWGHNFRPDYLKLARHADECQAERILALTATAPPKVLDDIRREFSIREERAIRTEFYRHNLRLQSTPTTAEDRDELLLARLNGQPPGATIVYVTKQKTAERVAGFLRQNEWQARHYHAGLKPDQRAETQDWFLSEHDAVIVATIAFGMGIDKPDIRYVYHYNVSKSIENYAQEIGRAGRDGAPSSCESLLVLDDLRTLENFVYGDTPDAGAVHSLVADVFSRGPDLGVSVYQLSAKHDIRDLVVRTLLTYLELDGYLAGGTPYYAEYKFKPLQTSAEILNHFSGDRRQFLATIFQQAKPGRIWYSLELETCIAATKSDRKRVVRALDYLSEQGMVELQAAGLHHRFKVLRSPDISSLSQSLHERMLQRQDRELNRLQTMIELLTLDGCQVSALGAYFGEPLPQPCGHCGWCETEQAIQTVKQPPPAIPTDVWSKLQAVRDQQPDVLAGARTFTRFACGVTSPAISRAKLSRHELFGCLAEIPFQQILDRAQ